MLRKKNKQMLLVQRLLARAASAYALVAIAQEYADTVPGYFLTSTVTFLASLEGSTMPGERKWQLLQEHMEETIDMVIEQESSLIPVLSVSAAVSPLLGLFGTVWGLIHAFVRISEKQSADITTIAPGIAEALITTLAGLLVAIPALVMAYALTSKVRAMEYQVITLAHRINTLVRILFW
jgi:biopolymer transport protein ExbB/TolQ